MCMGGAPRISNVKIRSSNETHVFWKLKHMAERYCPACGGGEVLCYVL